MIRVEYVALEHAATQISSVSREIGGRLEALRSQLQSLDWDGSDRHAYQAHQAAWDAAVADLNQLLGQIGRAVDAARESYLGTEAANARMWG